MRIEQFNGFVFDGPRLDNFDFPRIGHRIGIGEDIIHAFMDTETAGKSTDSKGRMKALYEPHKAYQYSSGKTRDALVKANLAYLKWGTRPYPRDSYPRIEKAYAIAGDVALLASSWGFPQILGKNYALAGYDSVEAMILDFQRDEDNQLEAMINFLKNSGLDDELRVLEAKLRRGENITPDDCRAVVRGYNGPGYEKNNYHVVFARNLNKWAKIPDTYWEPGMGPDADEDQAPAHVPVPAIRPDRDLTDGGYYSELVKVQERLQELGYHEVGSPDGKWGTKTRSAVLAFRADNDLPLVPEVDADLLAHLMTAPEREIALERRNATVSDLRNKGSKTVEAADNMTVGGTVLTGGSAVVVAGKALDAIDEKSSAIKNVMELVDPTLKFLQDNMLLVVIGIGVMLVYYSIKVKKARLEDHRTGKNTGR